MTHDQRLVFCKKCQNRDFDLNTGIFCKITGTKAVFENECSDFKMDQTNSYVRKPAATARPNKARARNAQVFIWVVLGLGFLSFISSYLQYDLLTQVQNGIDVTEEEITMNDLREGVIGLAHVIVYITSGIVFIMWFRRAYYNLNTRNGSRFEDGWAAGGWFVPILSLFRPYQIMKELDDETSLLIEKRSAKPVKRNAVFIGLWWALWIISNYVGQYIFKTSFRTDTIDGLLSSTTAQMWSFFIEIPLAALAVYLVKDISKKEEQLMSLEQEEVKLTIV